MALLVGAVLREAGHKAAVFFSTATAPVYIHQIHDGWGARGERVGIDKKSDSRKSSGVCPPGYRVQR